jgi:hypothetical protein
MSLGQAIYLVCAGLMIVGLLALNKGWWRG